ncbi:MAG: hypothetical protein HBSAPP04_08490 [Ignavibacteriaceae bacterium]|nr:MAG: hypothetical protein EDM75_04565 [Chlorobiota bacterium]GJQ32010.1 MAG: hypothetical protein HBSAPP04_08490 [Ignavibacteriaceae bacterium]
MSKTYKEKRKPFRTEEDDPEQGGFVKIKKKKRDIDPDYPVNATPDDKKKIDSQQFGTGHLVDDSLVHFDRDLTRNTIHDHRPVVVSIPPNMENRFLTKCHPCSTRPRPRDEADIVFLSKDTNPEILKDCYILLNPDYAQYFRYHNLLSKRFELVEGRKQEMRSKLQKLEGKNGMG